MYDALNVALTLPDFGLLRTLPTGAEKASRKGVTCRFEVRATDANILYDRATGALRTAFPVAEVRVRIE